MNTILWVTPIVSPQEGQCRWSEYMKETGWNVYLAEVSPNLRIGNGPIELIKKLKNQPCLIFGTTDSVLETVIQLKKEFKIPAIIYVWGFPPWRVHSVFQSYGIFQKLELMQQVDKVIACSYYTSSQLAELGISNSVIYPGIDTDLIDEVSKETESSQARDLSRIMVIARLVLHKNLSQILVAVGLLPKPWPKILIIGGGYEKISLESLASRLGINLEIRQQENDREKFALLLAEETKCLVSASTYEGLGLVPLEAMCCGKPVIVSDIPAHREILTNHVDYFSSISELAYELGFKFPSLNPHHSQAIEENKKYVKKLFSWKSCCEQLTRELKNAFQLNE